MVYNIITGILAVFCMGVLIIVIRVYKENNKLVPKKGLRFDDDEDEILFRP
jgi:hypothetical protein